MQAWTGVGRALVDLVTERGVIECSFTHKVDFDILSPRNKAMKLSRIKFQSSLVLFG